MKKIQTYKITDFTEQMKYEFQYSKKKTDKLHSYKEGVELIQQDLEKLNEEISKIEGERNLLNVKKQCIDIAAMALKFYHDLTI